MPKQLSLFSVASGRVSLKIILGSFWFYVWNGQLVVFVLSIILRWLQNPQHDFDTVIFPGLTNIGLSTLGIGPFSFIFVKLFIVLILNFLLVFLSYRFSKFLGAWFFSIFMIFLVLINFGMLLYW